MRLGVGQLYHLEDTATDATQLRCNARRIHRWHIGYDRVTWRNEMGSLTSAGGHLNPAVTLANCIYRKHPWRKLPIYALAQTLGAMCASGVVYANYLSAINIYEGGLDLRTVPGLSERRRRRRRRRTAPGNISCLTSS